MISIEKILHILLPLLVSVALVYASCGKLEKEIVASRTPKGVKALCDTCGFGEMQHYEFEGHDYIGARMGSRDAIFTHSGTSTNPIHFQNCK